MASASGARACKILDLPVLTTENRAKWPEWHNYYEQVYGLPVASAVDLNAFSWFYDFAPIAERPIESPARHALPVLGHRFFDLMPFGCPLKFVGNTGWPEFIVSKVGYFVKRPLRDDLVSDRQIEVLRTKAGEGSKETREAWFFHTVGSGFWVLEPFGLKVFGTEKKEDVANATLASFRSGSNNSRHATIVIKRVGVHANDANIPLLRGPRASSSQFHATYNVAGVLEPRLVEARDRNFSLA